MSLAVLLHDLEVAAYRVASGREGRDIAELVREVVRFPIGRGAPLVAILGSTAPHVEESESARRQFFHAARALVSLHRA